ncbi:B-cell receptor CD22-like protein [Labeo rohita]|uniref:B-cell receptor CD22-like protein n=1 Tax=Labeo rohita TaxID=84645 RepID=A0A498LW91_LABRO|nr:B-cell receptor CD22-like protein [Labeo rohita]
MDVSVVAADAETSGDIVHVHWSGLWSCSYHHDVADLEMHGAKEKRQTQNSGRLVILYISIGVICGAAVIILMLLIWRSRMKKRKDTNKTQMSHSRPDHERRTASDVASTEPLYENVTTNPSTGWN